MPDSHEHGKPKNYSDREILQNLFLVKESHVFDVSYATDVP